MTMLRTLKNEDLAKINLKQDSTPPGFPSKSLTLKTTVAELTRAS